MQENLINQNIVITESCKNLRTLGRNALYGKWKVAIIAMLIYTVCLELPPIIFDSIFGIKISNLLTSNGYTYGMDAGLYSDLYNSMPDYCVLSVVYIVLISGALSLGQALFFLASFRKHEVKATDIFLGFEKFGKALGLYIYQALFIFLWSCLFIIPGIIASIRYSQAFFVLADDPDKSITQCMDESKSMMNGNKTKYFLLSLSFIGWLLLASLPSGTFGSLANMTSNSFLQSLCSFIGNLFIIPVTVYMFSTFSGFYEILSGHLIKETRPVPVTPQEARQLQMEMDIHNEAETMAKENSAEAQAEETAPEEPDNSSYMRPKDDNDQQ